MDESLRGDARRKAVNERLEKDVPEQLKMWNESQKAFNPPIWGECIFLNKKVLFYPSSLLAKNYLLHPET